MRGAPCSTSTCQVVDGGHGRHPWPTRPTTRAVIVLRYQQDLTELATAEQLGIRVGTVKSTASRAIGKLRQAPDLIESHHGRQP